MNEKQQHQDLLRMRQLLNDPQSDPAEIADCYIRLIGEQLQALAATGYERAGRGVVEIDLRGIDLRHATGHVPIEYCMSDEADEEWPDGISEVIASYNPQHEVVAILLQDSGPLVYVLEDQQ